MVYNSQTLLAWNLEFIENLLKIETFRPCDFEDSGASSLATIITPPRTHRGVAFNTTPKGTPSAARYQRSYHSGNSNWPCYMLDDSTVVVYYVVVCCNPSARNIGQIGSFSQVGVNLLKCLKYLKPPLPVLVAIARHMFFKSIYPRKAVGYLQTSQIPSYALLQGNVVGFPRLMIHTSHLQPEKCEPLTA